MFYRFVIKATDTRSNHTYKIRAYNANAAFEKFLKSHRNLDIRKLEIIGDILPTQSEAVKKILKEEEVKKAKKVKRWQAAQKYQQLTGISVLTKKWPKN